jgi:ABC-type sugar transport system substrate-binding protein
MIQEVDNIDGPTAIANVRTMITEGIQGLVNSQVVATAEVAIDKLVQAAHIPAVSAGIQEKNAPFVTVDHYTAGYESGQQLAAAARKRYPTDTQPWLLNGVDAPGGPVQVQQGNGTVAAVKKAFPSLPASHIITVTEDGTGPVAYNATLSALSAVPSSALVIMTGTDSDVDNGMYQAAIARHRSKFLVEDAAGANLGLKNVCKYSQYTGSIDYDPPNWANYMLPALLLEMNGAKVPATINIPAKVVTKANDPFCH